MRNYKFYFFYYKSYFYLTRCPGLIKIFFLEDIGYSNFVSTIASIPCICDQSIKLFYQSKKMIASRVPGNHLGRLRSLRGHYAHQEPESDPWIVLTQELDQT